MVVSIDIIFTRQHQKMSIHFTGYGAVTPLGLTAEATLQALSSNASAIRTIAEWKEVLDLSTHVAAFVENFNNRFIPRKTRRTMSKMSEMLCLATDEALTHAGLSKEELNTYLLKRTSFYL